MGDTTQGSGAWKKDRYRKLYKIDHFILKDTWHTMIDNLLQSSVPICYLLKF